MTSPLRPMPPDMLFILTAADVVFPDDFAVLVAEALDSAFVPVRRSVCLVIVCGHVDSARYLIWLLLQTSKQPHRLPELK
jgi:hypothetical protein